MVIHDNVIDALATYAESLVPYSRPIAYAYQRADAVAAALRDYQARALSTRDAIRRFEWPAVTPETVEAGDVVMIGTEGPYAVTSTLRHNGAWVHCAAIGWFAVHRITAIYRHPDWRRPFVAGRYS